MPEPFWITEYPDRSGLWAWQLFRPDYWNPHTFGILFVSDDLKKWHQFTEDEGCPNFFWGAEDWERWHTDTAEEDEYGNARIASGKPMYEKRGFIYLGKDFFDA